MTAVPAQQLTRRWSLLDVSPVVPGRGRRRRRAGRAAGPGARCAAVSASSRSRCAPPPAWARSSAVAAEVPEILVGAGTVIDPGAGRGRTSRRGPVHRHARARRPGCWRRRWTPACRSWPGRRTLTEMMRLAEHGLTAMKFFPAEASGGRPYLSAVAGPMPRAAVLPDRRHPTANAADYLALPNVGCVGGSWLTPEGRRGRRRLGAHRGPRPEGRGPARLTAAVRRAAGPRGWPRGSVGRLRAGNSPRASGGGRSAMDESHMLAGCGDCCGLRFTLAVRSGARERQGIGWLARSHLTRPLGIH